MRLLYSQKQHSYLSFGLILFSHTNPEVSAKWGMQVVGMIFQTHSKQSKKYRYTFRVSGSVPIFFPLNF